MNERDAFLESVMPRLRSAEIAFHDGDAGPRASLWSHNDPVTLFGAAFQGSGWDKLRETFDFLASRFSGCESWNYEVLAAGASGDLAYIVGVEHTTASVGTAAAEPYALRVTTIFRREQGEWKEIHRHADPMPDSPGARAQVSRFTDERR
jgi:ketosteroid isomerase-like protein